MNKWWVRWLLFIAAASPAVIPLVLILKFGVNFHSWDEWDPHLAGLYIKAHDHQLTFGDLVRQHNEHRILVPRLAYLALTAIDQWNAIWEMVAQWMVVCVTSLGILWLSSRALREPDDLGQPRASFLAGGILFLWFLCNLIIFSPAAWENWLWGMGLANVMPMLFITGSLVAACSRLRLRTKTIFAMLLATMATYSSGNGILAWPLAGLLLAWPWTQRNWKANKGALIAWAVVAVVVVGTYFIGYTKPDHRAHPYATSISSVLMYIPAFLGGPFAFTSYYTPLTISLTVGCTELLLLVICVAFFIRRCGRRGDDGNRLDRDLCGRMLVWLVVAGFAIFSALIAAVARAGMGVEQAINSPRYVTFAVYLPVALVQMGALMLKNIHVHKATGTSAGWADRAIMRLAPALAATLIVAQLLTYPQAVTQCFDCAMRRRQGKAAVLLINLLPDNMAISALVFPDPQVVVDEAPKLSAMGYLHPPLIASADASRIRVIDPTQFGGVQGHIDRVAENPPGQINMIGWAALAQLRRPADAIFLTYDNQVGEPTIFWMMEVGMARDDIVQMLGADNVLHSGWRGSFPRSRLPNNGHGTIIAAWVLDSETGKAFRLPESAPLP